MAGLPLAGSVDGTELASRTIDGKLNLRPDYGLGEVMLSPGSSTWVTRPVSDQYPPSAEEVSLPDGSVALTWMEDSACDCSVAFGGRLVDGQFTRVELQFEDCEDDSLSDGGASWETQPLPGYDGEVTAAGIGACIAASDHDTVIALSVDGPFDVAVSDPRPVTALRISAGG